MTTARQLIEGALRLTQGVGRDAALSADDITEGKDALNIMLNGWEADHLLIHYRTQDVFNLTIGKRTYTYGTGGDINFDRPIDIEAVVLKDSEGRRYPLRWISLRELNQVVDLTYSAEPERWYYEPVYPLGRLEFDTSPDDTDEITVTALKPLADISDVDVAISLPPMYMRPIKFNLAIELVNEYGRSVKPETAKIAAESLNQLKAHRASQTVPIRDVDPGLQAQSDTYDIQSDTA